MTENFGIRVWILDPFFIDDIRINNIKNSQSIKENGINPTIVFICKLNSAGQFTYLKHKNKNDKEK